MLDVLVSGLAAGVYGNSLAQGPGMVKLLSLCRVVCLWLDSVPRGSWAWVRQILLTQAERELLIELYGIKWGHAHQPCTHLLGVFASGMYILG